MAGWAHWLIMGMSVPRAAGAADGSAAAGAAAASFGRRRPTPRTRLRARLEGWLSRLVRAAGLGEELGAVAAFVAREVALYDQGGRRRVRRL